MRSLIRPIHIDSFQELVELVCETIGEIVSGAVLLDVALGNDEFGHIDLVAADEDRNAVFLFIIFQGREIEYLRFFKAMQWYRENRKTLQKLYAGRVDLGLAPDVLILAPQYSDSMRNVLLNIGGSRIVLLRYVCFQNEEEKKQLFIEKIGDSSENSGKAAPEDHPLLPAPLQATHGFKTQPDTTVAALHKFRREIGTDISNVSDHELLDLLQIVP